MKNGFYKRENYRAPTQRASSRKANLRESVAMAAAVATLLNMPLVGAALALNTTLKLSLYLSLSLWVSQLLRLPLCLSLFALPVLLKLFSRTHTNTKRRPREAAPAAARSCTTRLGYGFGFGFAAVACRWYPWMKADNGSWRGSFAPGKQRSSHRTDSVRLCVGFLQTFLICCFCFC